MPNPPRREPAPAAPAPAAALSAPADRYLLPQVRADLERKMVFVGGPRQVGKTSLARRLLPSSDSELNFDVAAHRQAILRRELPPGDLWFFDEIHKYRGWRNYLKGLYDTPGRTQRILVTGSARLDLYRFGGDSLQGRYFHLRLHPFSVAELGGHADALPALLALGGFPEPFSSGSEAFARRWALSYRERLLRDQFGRQRVVVVGKAVGGVQVVKPIQRPKNTIAVHSAIDRPPARRAANGGGSEVSHSAMRRCAPK